MLKNKAFAYPILVFLIAAILYLIVPSSGKEAMVESDKEINRSTTSHFNYLPTSTTNQIIKHNTYTLSYDEKYEQAEWVAYELKKEHLSRTNRKRPLFQLDQKVSTKSAHWKNFKNSGYTKGHLLPAGDRKYSSNAFIETFLTSNISPQEYNFNAGVWNRLEQKVRYWVNKERHLYIVTGGVLKEDLTTIGSEKVAVPKYFYKVLLDYSKPEIKAIGFLVPHEKSNKSLFDFVVSIDSIEELTGIDFFPELSDELENELERSSNYKNWSF